MSWITVFWSINLGACLTLAAFYCAVWCKQRQTWAHLLFSCSAVAAAAISAFEQTDAARIAADTVDVDGAAMDTSGTVRPSPDFEIVAGLFFGEVRNVLALLRLCGNLSHVHILGLGFPLSSA